MYFIYKYNHRLIGLFIILKILKKTIYKMKCLIYNKLHQKVNFFITNEGSDYMHE